MRTEVKMGMIISLVIIAGGIIWWATSGGGGETKNDVIFDRPTAGAGGGTASDTPASTNPPAEERTRPVPRPRSSETPLTRRPTPRTPAEAPRQEQAAPSERPRPFEDPFAVNLPESQPDSPAVMGPDRGDSRDASGPTARSGDQPLRPESGAADAPLTRNNARTPGQAASEPGGGVATPGSAADARGAGADLARRDLGPPATGSDRHGTQSPAERAVAAQPPAGTPYKIEKADTLIGLARYFYDDGTKYTKILAANPGLDPDRLKVGQVIVIPPKDASSASLTARQPNAGNPASADVAKPVAGRDTYVVGKDDTLTSIARNVLKDPNRWREIYELNKDKLDSPDVIPVGFVLKLPPIDNNKG